MMAHLRTNSWLLSSALGVQSAMDVAAVHTDSAAGVSETERLSVDTVVHHVTMSASETAVAAAAAAPALEPCKHC